MQRGKTYKQRPTTVRKTRKATHTNIQAGGATMPEVREDTDGLYSGFEQHLRAHHPGLAKELEPWIDVCLTNNVLSQLGGEEKHKRILHAYYIGLANMYKIFDVAIEFLRGKYNREKKPIWAKFDDLKKKEANAIQFLTDLCNFVEFTSTDEQKEYRAKAHALAEKLAGATPESEEYKQFAAEVARNPADAFTEEDSKLQKLIKKGLPYLLMYPDRLTNIFINVLAEVFVMLKQNKESALMSRQLAQMKNDVDMDFKINDCKFGGFDQNKAEEIFRKLEFNSLINRLASIKN
jgi:5'-3' exonuclease